MGDEAPWSLSLFLSAIWDIMLIRWRFRNEASMKHTNFYIRPSISIGGYDRQSDSPSAHPFVRQSLGPFIGL